MSKFQMPQILRQWNEARSNPPATSRPAPAALAVRMPEVLVDTFGKTAPAIARAGQGARTLEEIKQGTGSRTHLGDYNDSNGRHR